MQQAMFLQQLMPVFQQCWSAETSTLPDTWTADRPAVGQDAATALVVQDFCGGAILTTTYEDRACYWNLLSTHPWLEADLTREQYATLRGPLPTPTTIDREALMQSEEVVQRYTTLRTSVGQYVHVR